MHRLVGSPSRFCCPPHPAMPLTVQEAKQVEQDPHRPWQFLLSQSQSSGSHWLQQLLDSKARCRLLSGSRLVSTCQSSATVVEGKTGLVPSRWSDASCCSLSSQLHLLRFFSHCCLCRRWWQALQPSSSSILQQPPQAACSSQTPPPPLSTSRARPPRPCLQQSRGSARCCTSLPSLLPRYPFPPRGAPPPLLPPSHA